MNTQCFIGEIYCLLVMKFYSNYNFLISNFDNYSSNLMVRNYLDQNILHTYYNLGINGHPNETVTGAYNTLWNSFNMGSIIAYTAEQYSKLQKKRARNSVPKCPCKLLQPADRPMAGSSSLEGHFGTGLRARFSSAWSNVGCAPT